MKQDALEIWRRGDMDGARLRELVVVASARELATLMADPEARTPLLDGIFEQMPSRLRAERATGLREVIHWHIEGAPGGGCDSYEVVIDDGVATVGRELISAPRVSFTVAPEAFLRMIAGETNGMKLMLTGKLKVRGDMMFAPRVEGLFDTDPGAR